MCEDASDTQLVFFLINDLAPGSARFQSLTQAVTDARRTGVLQGDAIREYYSLMVSLPGTEEYRQCGVALRESGGLDFYYDFRLVETSPPIAGKEESADRSKSTEFSNDTKERNRPTKRRYTAIDMDFRYLHFKCYEERPSTDESSAGGEPERTVTHYKCRTAWKQRIGLFSSTVVRAESLDEVRARLRELARSQSRPSAANVSRHLDASLTGGGARGGPDAFLLADDASTFAAGLEAIVSPYARIFSSFINAGRKFLLAHGQFVSIFNLTRERWTRTHHKFPGPVRQIFRNRKVRRGGAASPRAGGEEGAYDVGVLVGDSTFHFFEFEGLGKVRRAPGGGLVVDGRIPHFAVDQQKDTGFYFAVVPRGGATRAGKGQGGNVALKVLVDREVSDITPRTFLETHAAFSISMKYRRDAVDDPAAAQDDGSRTFAICLDALDDDEREVQDQCDLLLREGPPGTVRVDAEAAQDARLDATMVLATEAEQGGTEQSRMLGEIEVEGRTIRVTTRHIVILDDEGRITRVFGNRNVAAFIYVDGTWVYALKNGAVGWDNALGGPGGAQIDPGLYVYDFSRLLEGDLEVHSLSPALAGANDFIDFDLVTQTIAFIRNYSQIALMPLPHRNTIKFFGMGNKSDYLIWRQEDGCFTALDKSLRITTWSTVTGKILSSGSAEAATAADEDEDDDDLPPGAEMKRSPALSPAPRRGGAGGAGRPLQDGHGEGQWELYRANAEDQTYMGGRNEVAATKETPAFSFSLVISAEPCGEDGGSTASAPESINGSARAGSGEALDEPGGRFLDRGAASFAPFAADGARVRPFQAREGAARYRFRALKLQQRQGLGAGPSGLGVSSLVISFAREKKAITADEEFSFEMAVQTGPEARPYIYFSDDLLRMLVQDQHTFSADVFERDPPEKETPLSKTAGRAAPGSKAVKWRLLHHIHRYPLILKGRCSANFLFSPSFDRYIDIDYENSRFVIRDTGTEQEVGHIPSPMISISYKGRDRSERAIGDLASRIYFYSETEVRLITKEGLDCILDWQTLEVKSAAAVDNWEVEAFDDRHALLEQTPLETPAVFARLRRTCNRIKQMRAHAEAGHRRRGWDDESIQKALAKLTNEAMFAVDYTQPGCFSAELSFTALDLIILEKILLDKTYDFSNVPSSQRLQMAFNIFPGIRSVFHALAEAPNACNMELLNGIFDSARACKKEAEAGCWLAEGTIPLFQDAHGMTPMDACLNKEARIFNLKLVSVLLKQTQDYPLLHSAHLMQRAVCKAIEAGVPEIGAYLSARWREAPQLAGVQWMENQALNEPKKRGIPGYEYVAQETAIWVDKATLKGQVLTDAQGPQLSLRFWDIPKIVDQSAESDAFFAALASDEAALDIFAEPIVQIAVNRAWEHERRFFYLFVFLPPVLLLVAFTVWSNVLSVDLDQTGGLFTDARTQERRALGACYLIQVLCLIIFLQEVYQMAKTGVADYFGDPWNTVDLLPLVTASITTALFIQETYAAEIELQAESAEVAGDVTPAETTNTAEDALRYLRGGG